MLQRSDILVFIPTYNDTELLRAITTEVLSLPGGFQPLVVDDGSKHPVKKDDLALGTMLARLPSNFGLGAATHVAFDHAINHKYRIIARLDSDGQHPVSCLPDLVKPLIQGNADMVVGKRMNRDEGNGIRAWLAWIVRWYLTVFAGIVSGGKTPQDLNTGFFAVTMDAAEKLNSLYLERYPEPQIFLAADINDINLVECEISQNDREYGKSSITTFRALNMMYRFHILLLERILLKRPAK
jgi:glycosyltransferase involved in cell wall biosynthesis